MFNKIKKFMGFSSKNLVVTNENNTTQPQNTPVPHSEFSL